ncbi:MAG: hypothetical protein K2I92_06230 [Muribaculaceae bacterium]|nr:hypothetical protein [Muribaculaceae bacterium]
MANWLLYVIMGVSGAGVLGSGLIERQTMRMFLLLACVAVFEVMLLIVGQRFAWSVSEERLIGLFGGIFLVAVSYWIMPADE